MSDVSRETYPSSEYFFVFSKPSLEKFCQKAEAAKLVNNLIYLCRAVLSLRFLFISYYEANTLKDLPVLFQTKIMKHPYATVLPLE